MLTKTPPTNTAEVREESGKIPEIIDYSLLYSASQMAVDAADGLLTSRGNDDWIVVFRALAELTREQAGAGDPQPRFTMATVLSKCADVDARQRTYWLSEEDTARKKFTKAWEKLEEAFSGLEFNLRQRAEKAKVGGRVIPTADNDPLDKRARLFGFRLVGIDLPEVVERGGRDASGFSNESWRVGSFGIEYLEEMEVYPIPWFRRPLKVNVQGWRSLSLTIPPALFFLAFTFGCWVLLQFWLSDLPLREVIRGTLTVSILLAVIGWFVWPLIKLIEKKIIIAPAILQLAYVVQHVLLIRKDEHGKFVRMVRFTGTCPLCGGLVEIQKGKGSFRGRLVGECENNPVEHLFSFDHTLRRGGFLRE